MKVFIRIFGLLALLTLTGCGDDHTSVVRGKVLMEGEPITFGTIAFIGSGGRVDTTMIREDGTYEVTKAPQGDVVITVQTYPLPPQMSPPDAHPAKGDKGPVKSGVKYTPISAQYADEKQSPLKHTVVPGPQEHDLQLAKPAPAKGVRR